MAAAVGIGWGTRGMFVAGVALAHLAFWLDHVDGQVARWRGTVSLDGVYLDYLMHHAANLALGFALGYGLASRLGRPAVGDRRLRDRGRLDAARPAQRLPVQGVLPAAQGDDGELPGRRRQRRPSPAARSLAAPRPGGAHLAGVQGVRATRRLDRVDRSGGCGDRCPRVVANALAWQRVRHGRAGASTRHRTDCPRGTTRRGRG